MNENMDNNCKINTFFVKDLLNLPDMRLQFSDGLNIISCGEHSRNILKLMYLIVYLPSFYQGVDLEGEYCTRLRSIFNKEKLGSLVLKRKGIKFGMDICKMGLTFNNEKLNTTISFTSKSSRKINIEPCIEYMKSAPIYVKDNYFFNCYYNNHYLSIVDSDNQIFFIEEPENKINKTTNFLSDTNKCIEEMFYNFMINQSVNNKKQIFLESDHTKTNIIDKLIENEIPFKLIEIS